MHLLWLIPALPFAGFLVNGIFGRRFSKTAVNAVAMGSVLLSFLWALKIILGLGETRIFEHDFNWIVAGGLQVGCDFAVDRLTAVMLMVVTGVGALIHVYSIGYMAHEGGYYRFFAYMNLFMFFMLTLVLAANYLLLFVGWEGVGLCSYLLIGFWFHKKSATNAGNKAFIVNRIGDFGFSLAMLLIVVNFGTLDFQIVFHVAPTKPEGLLTTIALLLLVGACGKSAQFPLYVWLPDAMEGPTPVSALIHAATMVTAGVYMVARSFPIYQGAPAALEIVAYMGLFTAAFAATIGMVQNDIKKVFAYSTVSQLGYMFLGAGTGAYSAGIYHLMTHAFFKALLFLGAGSVIHALSGEQDMRNMGGLRKKIPVTFWTLMCAAVAISGVPPTAGFFSKDAILVAAYRHAPWMYWIGTITAGLTAFYVFRAMFLTFFGEYRGHEHPHESPKVMTVPLAVLAVLSIVGGFIRVPVWLEGFFPGAEVPEDVTLVVISVAAGLIGIFIAYVMYIAKPDLADSVASSLDGLYRLVYNKYFVDEIYDAAVVKPIVSGSRAVLWRGVDAGLIDGAVNGVGSTSQGFGAWLKLFQSGNIRSYATWVVFGSVVLVVTLGLIGAVR
jgi:NADH-quinone oxidoreductase subunit L